jgi:UTP--glucose-1-phosphate uridylyltransferase
MIKKVVLPSAGLGTRLLPATKQQPKEMLPIFTKGINGKLCLKPLLQAIFENLFSAGFREFNFITGRGKRTIEDHFTVDNDFLRYLESRDGNESARELDDFYEKIRKSSIVFVNQPEPRGFGDAVHCAKSSTGEEDFLVHAGDDLIVSRTNRYLSDLIEVFEDNEAQAAFCVERVNDPSKYGVMIGEKVAKKIHLVKRVIEKPSVPPSNLAIVAVYVFSPEIYGAIEKTQPDARNEVQLTNAIQQLIDEDCRVYGIELSPHVKRIDIGTPLSYFRALNLVAKPETNLP